MLCHVTEDWQSWVGSSGEERRDTVHLRTQPNGTIALLQCIAAINALSK